MRCEQFIYGLFNGGYRLIKSPGVDAMLTDDMFQKLKRLSQDASLLWPPHPPSYEPVVTCTHIEPTRDEYRREGTVMHTILFYAKDYLTHTPPYSLVSSHFYTSQQPPKDLEPLMV